MTELFTNYEEEFKKRIAILEKNDSVDSSDLNEIQELNDILEQMKMEAQNNKPLYKAKLRVYQTQLNQLKNQVSSDGNNNDTYPGDEDSIRRQRLLHNSERLQGSSQRLEDIHRTALETETMGADILQTLRSQRETMMRTRDAVSETDSYLDKASKTLKSMSRRFF
ncbi:hypothetical protein BDA99DRAFT_528275 [Phascolomyces articulosus]|uniref:t-SNARE coiled-coil homology domain-containing protein n=1 Tax=Phascolomyces articulosus TaxID=60185 RepID=A0AAD5JLN4_9FUNG|nr:hypothetical protein BDA99DRAFT_528275 [Phascolomyces articulosus]